MNQATLFQTEECKLPGYPARWSDCKRYRYTLWRTWTDEPEPNYVAWIGLNPSTATESEDDPTLRRVMGFTRAWGEHGTHLRRSESVRVLLHDTKLHYLALNKSGECKHPLYLPANLQPVEWRRERVLDAITTTPDSE